MPSSRMVTTSRRAGRVTNKTKLLIYRGSDKVDLGNAEIIVWEHDSTSGAEATKHQHVGAKGVESGELLEHHLQAALSSASLLHSRTTKPSSSPTASRQPRAEPTTHNTLNYHIPTPDATGQVETGDYAKLYQTVKYAEPVNFIRFSDTVEESSGGWGGLGYCMDDEDEKWLSNFNAKAEGASGDPAQSPVRDSHTTSNIGRPKRDKGKDREKETPAPVFISEDTFEYVMGMLEKYTEESVQMLHTNLSLLPPFSSIEPLFTSPVSASFMPSNELPTDLPEPKALLRIARSVYPHWKQRREIRKGRTVMPILNYDESNDGDPYVCFRRRDIRATRKTRRTDNFSVERMQKIQSELRSAHNLAQMVLVREQQKKLLYKSDKEVWEAKWKLFETKRRWPSLSMSREEEEIITGRLSGGTQAFNPHMMSGHHALQAQQQNIPQMRKKVPEREREEREKRERAAEAVRAVERGLTSGGRQYAPEMLKERVAALKQELDEMMAKKKEADAQWDDATDNSYQPLPPSQHMFGFRPTDLDRHYTLKAEDGDDDQRPLYPASFRLRRGRGGFLRLDRRRPVLPSRRGVAPSSPTDFSSWIFPDNTLGKNPRQRPRSIDQDDADEDERDAAAKRRKLNEIWRYDADHGGCVGVGMGISEDQDRIVIDDLDAKYVRNRVTLLNDDDIEKLRPDSTAVNQAILALDTPEDMPPTPVFNRPALVATHPHVAAQIQQQHMMQQQQQIEQFQRFQVLAQQQAAAQQQAQAAAVAAQMQQQQMASNAPTPQMQQGSVNSSMSSPVVHNSQMPPPNGIPLQPQNGRPPNVKRPSSQNGSMLPPNQTRPSISPTNSMHAGQPQIMQMNGQSPQLANGMVLPNGKAGFAQGQIQLDPAHQQRILQARAAAFAQYQAAGHVPNVEMNGAEPTAEQMETIRSAQQAGFTNVQHFLEARNKARQLQIAKLANQQQQQQQQQAQALQQGNGQQFPIADGGNTNGNGTPQAGYTSPAMQLKFPPHAQAKISAAASQRA